MKIIFFLSGCCLLLTGCMQDSNRTDRRNIAEANSEMPSYTRDTRDVRNPRDRDVRDTSYNRDVNYRDTSSPRSDLLTPQNQSESPEDRRITQQARQALMNRRDFSTNAKNIKIITIRGEVQLRGNVNNEMERREIVAVIRQIPGIQRVDEKLVVSNQGE